MTSKPATEKIACPYCNTTRYVVWAQELNFTAVRCEACALIYVNPRPTFDSITAAVATGTHSNEAYQLNVVSRRIDAKVKRYRKIFASFFDDVWRKGVPISWLDVGAGYGEIIEAVNWLAPKGSRVEGLEPMKPKAIAAKSRGLIITEDYLRPSHPKVDIVSVVDVFSHIPEFGVFLSDVRNVLHPHGEIFIETGNLADLERRDQFPGELGLPDHLVFAGEAQLRGFLDQAGFEIVRIQKLRVDGAMHLAKNVIKKILGRPVKLAIPYTSRYRSLLVRARLRRSA